MERWRLWWTRLRGSIRRSKTEQDVPSQRRAIAFFAMALLTLVSGLATGNAIWFTLAYLLGLILIVSFLWAWVNVRWVRLARQTRSRRAQVGQLLEERFRVQNTGVVPKLWLEVRDFSTMPNHQTSRVLSGMRPNGVFNWRVNTICQRRGRYQLGPMSLRSSDPFGLFPMERRFDATANVVVYPMTVPIHDFALPAGVLSGGDALRRRTFYITTNAAGVRDYAPGDSFGRIHWKSSARRDRLIVKEFELDPLADIWIVPDMCGAAHVAEDEAQPAGEAFRLGEWVARREQTVALPRSSEEYTVTVAASVAQYFLRLDRAVGLLAYGQSDEILQPDRGERQLNRILETMAVLRATGIVPLADMLYAEAPIMQRGTTIVTISPTIDAQWGLHARELMRRGMRVVSIVVNPASFGGAESAEPLLHLLQANGVIAHLINYGDDLSQTLSHTRQRF